MRFIKIKGSSMEPILFDRDIILIIKPRTLGVGFIYIVNHPELGLIVKRLAHQENGNFYLAGENKASTPASLIAPVKQERIIGRAVLAFGKTGLRLLRRSSP